MAEGVLISDSPEKYPCARRGTTRANLAVHRVPNATGGISVLRDDLLLCYPCEGRILNAHDTLLAACKGAQAAVRNICENATNYKKLTIPQLRFFVETATAMLSGLATVADAAIALAEPQKEGE